MLRIPRSAQDFTVPWLNEALAPHLGDARVVGCTARAFESPGQTAGIVMLDVAYSSACGIKPKLVAKIATQDPMVLQEIIAPYDFYRRETSFYREFPDIGISVPRMLHARHDPATQQMVLLMEDLSPAASPSWAITPEQVELAAGALPGMHGRWWNNPVLREKQWLVQFDDAVWFRSAFDAAAGAGPALTELYEDAATTNEIMALCSKDLDRLLRYLASRPYTLVHGDYHAKQMFFPTAAGGEFAVIDWQFPFVCQGAWDLALLVGGLATERRQAMEGPLLQRYLSGLEAMGVAGYSRSALEDDFRVGLVWCQVSNAIASVSTDPQIAAAECDLLGLDWRDVFFMRTQRALEAWDVLDFVRDI